MARRSVKLPSARHRRPGAARVNSPGGVLRCLLLARGPEWVVVDVATGALVRSRASGWPVVTTDSAFARATSSQAKVTGQAHTGPELDVVEIELAADDEPSDPARPEAVMIQKAPQLLGTPKAASRAPDPKRAAAGRPEAAPSRLARPVDLLRGPRRLPPVGGTGRSRPGPRFRLGQPRHVVPVHPRRPQAPLPVLDERVVEVDGPSRGGTLAKEAVEKAVGGTPKYLVVALGAPRQGQSPKLVLGVLPRP